MSSGRTPEATLKDWVLLTRPWSVTAPIVPFLVGFAYVSMDNAIEPGGIVRWALGLLSGILLVLACNLFNTWGDERSGVDRMPGAVLTTPQIQAGKITLRQTFVFGCVLFLLAAFCGLPTLFVGLLGDWFLNKPLLFGALIGFWGAVNYSTGFKYKYRGWGVPAVAFLEGTLYVFVVMALLMPLRLTCWFCAALGEGLTAHEIVRDVISFLVYSLPVAALVGVILHGNDMRDIATDRRAGIRSVAMALGPKGSLVLFITLHLIPYLVPAGLLVLACFYPGERSGVRTLLLPFLVLPATIRLLRSAVRDYRANPAAPAWLNCEKGSGAIHFQFGFLYALGLLLVK